MTLKQFIKEIKILIGSFRFDWKKLFLVNVIDIRKDNEKTKREKRFANAFFGGLFGFVAFLVAAFYAPHIKLMISSFVLVAFAYIGFCAIMRALQRKINNSGRKAKAKIESFQELFFSPLDFDTIDGFVKKHYSPVTKMTTSDCRCLLDIIIEKHLVRDESMDPMVTLFHKQYPDLLPPYTNRAFTKVKIEPAQKQKMEAELFKSVPKNKAYIDTLTTTVF